MWLTVLLICIGLQVSARYSQYLRDTLSDEDETEEPLPYADTMLDMRGTLRKFFALEAALEDHQRNMICSPMLAMIPLGKLILGSEKETERELMTALGIKSKKQIKGVFTQLIANLEYLPGVTMDLASRIYINSKKIFNKKFVKRAKKIFKSGGPPASKFKVGGDPKRAAKEINGWVSEKMKRKVRRVIKPSEISEDTSMIVVNAIYFAGRWKKRFTTVYTDDFYAPSGIKMIPMMSRTGLYNYWQCDTLHAQIIEIPYEGEGSSMIIVLPFSKTGLPILMKALKLAPELLNQALEKMKLANVILSMPKFNIDSDFDMSELYRKIGIRTIFDPKTSRLTGIMDDEVVFVSKSIHKAIIEVNHVGTETAAVSDVIPDLTLPAATPMTAEHPFLFFVKGVQEPVFTGIFTGDKKEQRKKIKKKPTLPTTTTTAPIIQ